MEAYDAAVLSYALATASTKTKPGLLGIAPMLPLRILESESLTPPRFDILPEPDDSKNYLYQLLLNIEQQIINKVAIQLPQLMEVCATKPAQIDQQIIAYLEALQNELKQICKMNPMSTHLLQLRIEDDGNGGDGACLKTEVVCKTLTELLKQFGLNLGANILKNRFPVSQSI